MLYIEQVRILVDGLAVILSRGHKHCNDGWYACPKNEKYFGRYDNMPIEERPCKCHIEDIENILREAGITVK